MAMVRGRSWALPVLLMVAVGCTSSRVTPGQVGGGWSEPARVDRRLPDSTDMRPLPELRLVPFQLIGTGWHYGGPRRTVLKDARTLIAHWDSAHVTSPIPAIAFDKAMVLVILAGPVHNDGRAAVDSVGMLHDTLAAVVAVEQGCLPLNITHQPALVVLVPRHDGPVAYIERRRPAPNCDTGR